MYSQVSQGIEVAVLTIMDKSPEEDAHNNIISNANQGLKAALENC